MSNNRLPNQLKISSNQFIADLLGMFLVKVQSILTTQFVGMYIGGSIANDSFEQATSDIDCYIITSTVLSKNEIAQIELMHKQLYSSNIPYANKLEASYIPQEDLLNFNPENSRPYFNEGNFYLAPYGNNFLIELFILREKSITIYGAEIKNLIKKLSAEDLRRAIKNNLYEYWEPVLTDTSKFERNDYQVFAILTMCRTLYSLGTGRIASKSNAAQWTIDNTDSNWKNLIELALKWKPGNQFNKLKETQKFVKYILDNNSAE